MRSIKGAERRLELLLKANHIVAKAKNLRDGLQSLAEMLGDLLPHTYCRILLMDESEEFMAVEAAYPSHVSPEHAEDESGAIRFEDWPGLHEWLRVGKTRLLEWINKSDRPILTRLSRLWGVEDRIHSLLMVPLNHEGKALGMMEFGAHKAEGPRSFTHDEIKFAKALAEGNINLIDRMRLHDRIKQREHLLTKLNEASLHIRAAREPDKLLQEIVRLGVELVGCNIGGIYVNIRGLKVLERRVTHGLPEGHAGERLEYHNGLIGQTADTGKSYISDAWHKHVGPGFDAPDLTACVTIPIKNEAGEVEAVLFVASDEPRKRLKGRIKRCLSGSARRPPSPCKHRTW